MTTQNLTDSLAAICATGGNLKADLAALEPHSFAQGALGRANQAIVRNATPETTLALGFLDHFFGFPLVQYALTAVIARDWISKVDFEALTKLWRENVGPVPA